MKKYLLTLLSVLLLSCSEEAPASYKETSTFELRQLVSKEVTTKQERASFFLISGSYSSSEKVNEYIKVFAKVDSSYRLITIPMGEARIKIDNTLTIPTLKIRYTSRDTMDDNELCTDARYYNCSYIISCPEIYMPEKLLPITIQ